MGTIVLNEFITFNEYLTLLNKNLEILGASFVN